VIATLRTTGIQLALDDYGTARASMNLWVRLRPDVVKVDHFFIHGIVSDSLKFEAVKAMQHFANASGARLIAEGIDNVADILVVRISCGQGFYFGHPCTQPLRFVADKVRQSSCV
jgi:EAL domain-containing protein (putative c-di-GMP-specific phosphodiesterase class I)